LVTKLTGTETVVVAAVAPPQEQADTYLCLKSVPVAWQAAEATIKLALWILEANGK